MKNNIRRIKCCAFEDNDNAGKSSLGIRKPIYSSAGYHSLLISVVLRSPVYRVWKFLHSDLTACSETPNFIPEIGVQG